MERTPLGALRRWVAWVGMSAIALLMSACAGPHAGSHSADLPSWNDGPSRQAIVAFVQAVTAPGSPDFVPAEQRVAVFDNDGTLWSEQPMYFQVLYALDRIKTMAPQHPEWARRQPFKAAIEGDQATLARSGQAGLMKIVAVTQTGMSVDDFTRDAAAWAATARHPRFNQRYIDMTYAPMRELLGYLRASGFQTYIVSGGEVEFMRAWAPAVYGIPPEQIIGTTFVTTFDNRPGAPVLWREGKLAFNDDGPGKPVAIQRHIGRRPIMAFGNSDGDLQMLQWTAAGEGRRFAGLVHHTDARREWAYDRTSQVGRLDQALDEARRQGWTVVDMQAEWSRVYSFEHTK
ncbi:HAD family hydrolase [Bordetella petrii]|uniref:HAD family hydrolase n=1 Tax=Bordetella petrii TaxID=94624 RepID=UPI001A97788A|nr:HAD family hydrolase [Bordetella petrii]MBO1113856.1 haloacid dehalogenase-like hydrolase [Bordetella petrii]